MRKQIILNFALFLPNIAVATIFWRPQVVHSLGQFERDCVDLMRRVDENISSDQKEDNGLGAELNDFKGVIKYVEDRVRMIEELFLSVTPLAITEENERLEPLRQKNSYLQQKLKGMMPDDIPRHAIRIIKKKQNILNNYNSKVEWLFQVYTDTDNKAAADFEEYKDIMLDNDLRNHNLICKKQNKCVCKYRFFTEDTKLKIDAAQARYRRARRKAWMDYLRKRREIQRQPVDVAQQRLEKYMSITRDEMESYAEESGLNEGEFKLQGLQNDYGHDSYMIGLAKAQTDKCKVDVDNAIKVLTEKYHNAG